MQVFFFFLNDWFPQSHFLEACSSLQKSLLTVTLIESQGAVGEKIPQSFHQGPRA